MHTPCSPSVVVVECSSDYVPLLLLSSPQLIMSAGEGLCVMLLLRAAGLSACVDVRITGQT